MKYGTKAFLVNSINFLETGTGTGALFFLEINYLQVKFWNFLAFLVNIINFLETETGA